MSRELRLLQEANRRAREAGAAVARLTALLARREREGWDAAWGEIDGLRATVARLERTLDAEQRRAARDLAAHDRDRRIAQRQLRVAAGALHRAVRDGWLGAEEARAALADGGRGAVKQHMGIWRDLRVKRRPTEVDVLTGVVVTRGRELGIATPVNAAILDLVHAIEVGQTGMGWENLRAIAERAGLMTTV